VELPTLAAEHAMRARAYGIVFGVDEAGRGCLAGPVTAAIAALPDLGEGLRPPDDSHWAQVKDSKKLSRGLRRDLEIKIQAEANAWGVGYASREEIDRFNILEATALAVIRALEQALSRVNFMELAAPPRIAFLVDGKLSLVGRGKRFALMPEYRAEFEQVANFFAGLELNQQRLKEECLVGGDSKSISIAAASVLAKESRDRWMEECDLRHPGYEFAVHKGYFTARHRELLQERGPSPEHRQSFAPVRALIGNRSLSELLPLI
jgi:ribonuclease HII